MILKQTWIKLSDSSQAQWLKVFHLYKGFYRKKTRTGYEVKGSVRVVQPMMDPYKGYTIKRVNKGKVAKALLTRQTYSYLTTSSFRVKSKLNSGVLLKSDGNLETSHVMGPCFRNLKKKKLLTLFKGSI